MRVVENLKNIIIDIFKNTTIKRHTVAEYYDTDVYKRNFDAYKASLSAEYTLYTYDYVYDDFLGIIDEEYIDYCLESYTNIEEKLSITQIETLISNARNRISSNYIEYNVYYRTICGLPPLKEGELDTDFVIYYTHNNKTKMIHEYDDSTIAVLKTNGTIDAYLEDYPWMVYLKYLHRRTDIYTARTADMFDILHIGYELGYEYGYSDKVQNVYNRNKRVFVRQYHNQYYMDFTQNYETMMILYLIITTMMDTISEYANNPYNDYNNPDDILSILNDYNIPDFDIPFRMKSELAMNINSLIRGAGSRQTLIDLSKIFNINTVCRIVIHRVNSGDDNILKCHKVPLDEFSPKAISECEWISFNELVKDDKLIPETEKVSVEAQLKNTQFCMIDTNYISVDDAIDVNKTSMDCAMFFRYLINHSEFTVLKNIRHTEGHFNLSIIELISYMSSLKLLLYKYADDIPDTISEVDLVTSRYNGSYIGLNDINNDDLLSLRAEFELYFAGEDIRYLLKDWKHVDSIETKSELIGLFFNNRSILDKIQSIMNSTYDYNKYNVCKRIYDLCTTLKAKKEVFGDYTTYTDYIKGNNSNLYDRLLIMKDETDNKIIAEIAFCLDTLRDMIESLNDTYIKEFDFIGNMRDMIDKSFKSLVKKIILYFSSDNLKFKDTPVSFVIEYEVKNFKIYDEMRFFRKIRRYADMRIKDDLQTKRVAYLDSDKRRIKDLLLTRRK